MADKQPEALRLADNYADACFDQALHGRRQDPAPELAREALEAELRRQHALIAELVGALEGLSEAVESMQATFGRLWGATPEDDDTYIHEKWAEGFLAERLVPAAAALAKAKEAA